MRKCCSHKIGTVPARYTAFGQFWIHSSRPEADPKPQADKEQTQCGHREQIPISEADPESKHGVRSN